MLGEGRLLEYERPEILIEDKSSIFHGMAKEAGLLNPQSPSE